MKVIFSGIGVTNGRNKVGEFIFSRNRGGNYKKAYAIPTNTITPTRTAIRNLFGISAQMWQFLSEGERQLWNKEVLKLRKRDRLGTYYFLSGYDYFTKTMFLLQLQGAILPSDIPGFRLPAPLHSAFVTSLSALTFAIQCNYMFGSHTVPDSSSLVISATPAKSIGVSYCRNTFNIIAILPVLTATNPIDIYADYVAVFGVPTINTKIFVKAQPWSTKCGAQAKPIIFAGIVS